MKITDANKTANIYPLNPHEVRVEDLAWRCVDEKWVWCPMTEPPSDVALAAMREMERHRRLPFRRAI